MHRLKKRLNSSFRGYVTNQLSECVKDFFKMINTLKRGRCYSIFNTSNKADWNVNDVFTSTNSVK